MAAGLVPQETAGRGGGDNFVRGLFRRGGKFSEGEIPPPVRIPTLALPYAHTLHCQSPPGLARGSFATSIKAEIFPQNHPQPTGVAQVQSLTPTPPKHFGPLKEVGGVGVRACTWAPPVPPPEITPPPPHTHSQTFTQSRISKTTPSGAMKGLPGHCPYPTVIADVKAVQRRPDTINTTKGSVVPSNNTSPPPPVLGLRKAVRMNAGRRPPTSSVHRQKKNGPNCFFLRYISFSAVTKSEFGGGGRGLPCHRCAHKCTCSPPSLSLAAVPCYGHGYRAPVGLPAAFAPA